MNNVQIKEFNGSSYIGFASHDYAAYPSNLYQSNVNMMNVENELQNPFYILSKNIQEAITLIKGIKYITSINGIYKKLDANFIVRDNHHLVGNLKLYGLDFIPNCNNANFKNNVGQDCTCEQYGLTILATDEQNMINIFQKNIGGEILNYHVVADSDTKGMNNLIY